MNTGMPNFPSLYAIPLPQRAVAVAKNNVRGRSADTHDFIDDIDLLLNFMKCKFTRNKLWVNPNLEFLFLLYCPIFRGCFEF
jgi:hypothetical protein